MRPASVTEIDIRASATFAAQNLGYQTLKDLQMEAILAFAIGHDVFAVLPTGFGKSLCYACLPGMFDHLLQPEEPSLVIVCTSLTAIMEDQVSRYMYSV